MSKKKVEDWIISLLGSLTIIGSINWELVSYRTYSMFSPKSNEFQSAATVSIKDIIPTRLVINVHFKQDSKNAGADLTCSVNLIEELCSFRKNYCLPKVTNQFIK